MKASDPPSRSRVPGLLFVIGVFTFILLDSPFRSPSEILSNPAIFVLNNQGGLDGVATAFFVILFLAALSTAWFVGETKSITNIIREPDEKTVRFIVAATHAITVNNPNISTDDAFKQVAPEVPMMMAVSRFDPDIAKKFSGSGTPTRPTVQNILDQLKDVGALGHVKAKQQLDDGSFVDIDVTLDPKEKEGRDQKGAAFPGRMLLLPQDVYDMSDLSSDEKKKLLKMVGDEKNGENTTGASQTT